MPELPPDSNRGKRIAVVGAGPGGLSAAIALHQAGFEVTVFERHKTTQAVGGAILLNAIGLHILRSYGAEAEGMHTVDLTEFRRFDGRTRVVWRTDPALIKQAGSTGWISGTMRSEVYARLLAVAPSGLIVNGKQVTKFEDRGSDVVLHFTDGTTHETDLVVAADGITSVVREQLWGKAELKDVGISVYLGWAELPGRDRKQMICHHDDKFQLGYAPLNYQGKECFEWWFVERYDKNDVAPADPKAYVIERTKKFAEPVPDIIAATDAKEGMFRWVVKYKDPLPAWSKGRVTLLGDAAHPTSPYAGYGAGMAIEDGFFLGKFLQGRDLSNPTDLAEGLALYDAERVDYTNKVTAFARSIGKMFHGIPWIARRFRDFMLDYTKIPDKQISKGYTEDAQVLLESILAAEKVPS